MKAKLLMPMVLLVCLGFYHLLNPLRLEHLLMLTGGVIAWHAAKISREFILVFLPLILFGWIYDLLRLFSERAARIVTIAEVREAELAIFGWWEDGERVGPVEFFLDRHHPFFDVLGAPIYASHVGTIIIFGVLTWWWTRRLPPGTERCRADQSRLHRFLWGFLLLNLIGFTVQVLYPVAPPWYVELYGYAMPEQVLAGQLQGAAAIPGNPAGLARVDALIGIDYFQGIYGQASYVFGAMPSLHVAYPLWLTLHVRSRPWKAIAALYCLAMAVYAVYYIHHYVVDLVGGAALPLLVYVLFTRTPLARAPELIHRWLVGQFLSAPRRGFLLERGN